MDYQRCDIVVVKRFSEIEPELVDETFKMAFKKNEICKRSFSTRINTITIFYIKGKTIDSAKVKKFENFLTSVGYAKLHTANYLEKSWEVDARFFTVNLNMKHFSDIKTLLIEKIEKALEKKLEVHDDIYYFYLTKSQMKSRPLVRLIDELLDNPAINYVICI